MKTNNRKGFTLAELLIVVAIIAVLVAISIPIFSGQLEKAKQATDLANMRSAKAAVAAEWMMGDMSSEEQYVYDAGSGRAIKASEAGNISGYGKSSKNASEFASELNATGIPNNDGTANFLTLAVSSDGEISMRWGSGGFTKLSSIAGTPISSKWWDHTSDREQSFNHLRDTVTNEKRKESDKEILNDLASYFEGMSVETAKSIMGDAIYANISKGTRLFEYGQDGGGSIRLSGFGSDNQPYLKDLGYDADNYITGRGDWRIADGYYTGANNYVNKYLFTSDEMLGTAYKSQTFHGVHIKAKVSNGKLSDVEVYVQGLQNQGFTSK